MQATIAVLFAFGWAVSARTGSSIVVNQSPEPFYLWVVPSSSGNTIGDRKTVPAGGAWAEELHTGTINNSTVTTGVAIKISKDENGLYNGAPLQILGYALADDRIWYNLDAINGAPFKGQKVVVSNEGAGSILWPNGEDIGDVTRDNAAGKDLVLVISGNN